MSNRDNFKWSSPDIYPILKDNAKENRNNATVAEQILWELLRRRQLGYRFRRQYIIDDFIADFACLEKKLIIEIDGGYHNSPEQTKEDNIRSNILNKYGFYVTRFTNSQVINEIDTVIDKIKTILENIK